MFLILSDKAYISAHGSNKPHNSARGFLMKDDSPSLSKEKAKKDSEVKH